MSLCDTCFYNSDNDFFEPDIEMSPGAMKIIEICVAQRPAYPHAAECDAYEPIGRVDGD